MRGRRKQRRLELGRWAKGMVYLVIPALVMGGYLGVKGWRVVRDRLVRVAEETSAGVARVGWLSIEGDAIVDTQRQRVWLKGVNLCCLGWGQDEWFPRAIEELSLNWGVNVIRTRVYEERFLADPEGEFEKLEKYILRSARKHGMYVVLHPSLRDHVALPNKTTAGFWRVIAGRYKDDPTVIYDLLSEPHDVTEEETREAYASLIESVREIHPRSLVLISGLDWGREINTYAREPMAYENVVYRSNPYNSEADFQSKFGEVMGVAPMFLGEFGADGYPPMSREDVGKLMDLADKYRFGYTAWNFNSRGCPCLLSDYESFTRSAYGEVVWGKLRHEGEGNTL